MVRMSVTRRQAAVLALAAALGGGAAAAAALGQPAAAAAAAGVATSATLAAVVQVRRRLREVEVRLLRAVGTMEQELVHRLSALEFGQRRVVAALEAERLAAAECRCRPRAALGDGQPGASPDDGGRAEAGRRERAAT